MKKFIYIFASILFFISLTLFSSCKEDKNNPVEPTTEESIGELSINPSGIFVNAFSQITFRLTVPAAVDLKDSTIKVIKLDSENKPAGDVGFLYDNGNLGNGDEIVGDNVYSGIFWITQPDAGELKLRATAVVESQGNKEGNSNSVSLKIFTDLTSAEFAGIINTQNAAETKLVQYLNGNSDNIESAMDQVAQWLQSQSAITSAVKQGTTSIEIKYNSGVYGGLIVSVEGANGKIDTRGGVISKDDRKKSRKIPLHKQTTGTLYSPETFQKVYAEGDCADSTIIGNRNVLIYAPFEAAFSTDEGPDVENILKNSGFEFSITYLKDQQATIGALSNLTSYGYVVFATHGSGGKAFATGEIADTNNSAYQDTYKAMLKAEKLAIWRNIVIKKEGTVKTSNDIYAIRFPFISDLAGTFPNSVILNNSCESTKSKDLANAFIGKKAKTYFGYSKVVNSGFCLTKAREITTNLAKELKTSGQSFVAGSDPVTPFAVFEKVIGSDSAHYPESLVNGDFECGNLFGWTKSGDGRVISKLASINPTGGKYLGIISTGLGFTTATGSIFQTFRVPSDKSNLTLSWYFLSEEFLEFINSQFQDYFTIKIKTESGSEITLLEKTIDGLAAEFGASHNPDVQGNLISQSPGIVFDRGDVFGTGWMSVTFGITGYRGQKITLILSAGDVGDSIYDTAILLDECKLE